MERANLSQTAVGKLAGRDRSMANRWLGGHSRPTYEAATAFATAIVEHYPPLSPLTERFLRAAGYRRLAEQDATEALSLSGALTPDTASERSAATVQEALEQVRAIATQENKSVGDVLVDRGLATRDELALSGDARGGRIVREILESSLSEETKNVLLMNYVGARGHLYRTH